MLNVQIICIGKLKESYFRDACAEYSKRLSAFCKFDITELDEYKAQGNPSDSQIKIILENEGKKIIDKISDRTAVIPMCIEGKQMKSEALADYLQKLSINGVNSVAFVIGGSWGLSKQVKDMGNLKLSMSEMTFPHQLARVMLCEQIYRAFQIISGGKYHK